MFKSLSCQFKSGITVLFGLWFSSRSQFSEFPWKARSIASRSRSISQCFALYASFHLAADEQAPLCVLKICHSAMRCKIFIWNFQGCIAVHLSRFHGEHFVFARKYASHISLFYWPPFSAATLISYHSRYAMSIIFFKFLNFLFHTQKSFLQWIFIISHHLDYCQYFFKHFSTV